MFSPVYIFFSCRFTLTESLDVTAIAQGDAASEEQQQTISRTTEGVSSEGVIILADSGSLIQTVTQKSCPLRAALVTPALAGGGYISMNKS